MGTLRSSSCWWSILLLNYRAPSPKIKKRYFCTFSFQIFISSNFWKKNTSVSTIDVNWPSLSPCTLTESVHTGPFIVNDVVKGKFWRIYELFFFFPSFFSFFWQLFRPLYINFFHPPHFQTHHSLHIIFFTYISLKRKLKPKCLRCELDINVLDINVLLCVLTHTHTDATEALYSCLSFTSHLRSPTIFFLLNDDSVVTAKIMY